MQPDSAMQIVDLSKVYWVVGAVIVMNLGTIVTIAIAGAKSVWWLAQLSARVEQNAKDINNLGKIFKSYKDEG